MSASDPTVYLVDDDVSVRRALTRLLRAAGFCVETFQSGPEFLQAIDERSPGCVLLDVRMPGMSGFDVADQLAARDNPIAVILITGDGDVGTAERARKAGCVNVLAKPFEDVALLQAVKAALERHGGRP